MTLEAEVAALTTATTDLLAAVNVSKATLDANKNTAVEKAAAAAASEAAAVSAKDQAVTAKDASEAAHDASVTAQHASETARDQSITAKTASETARDQSVTAKTASETARDAAVTAKTAAETARDAAVIAKLAAEAAASASIKPVSSTASDDFVDATAYDQHVKLIVGGRPRFINNAAIAPSLDFNFAKNKSLLDSALDRVFGTFTRASSGTYMDANGVMQTASSGLPRFSHDPADSNARLGLLVEPQRTNLVLQSNGFDTASWVKTNTTVTAASGAAPDGTNSAYKVVAVSGNTLNNVDSYLRTGPITLTTGSAYTISAYAKKSGYGVLQLRVGSATLGSQITAARFNVSTGTLISVTTGYNASIQSVGNGWYRCSITGKAASTTYYAGLYNDDSSEITADGTSGILLWGFQLEQAADASTYIPTATAQVTRAADVLSLADSGWLNQAEGTFYVDHKLRALKNNQTLLSLDNGTNDLNVRTVSALNTVNLLTFSEQFESGVWNKTQTTISPKAILSPDGVTSADKIIPNTVAGSHSVGQIVNYTAGMTYTFSAYVKAAGYNFIRFVHPGAAITPSSGTYFNLSNGTLLSSSNGSGTITSVGDGWYKITWTGTATSTIASSFSLYIYEEAGVGFGGNGVKGAFLWHPQIEASGDASTYEPNPKYITSYEIGADGLIQTINYADTAFQNLYQKSTFGYKANDAAYYRGGASVGTDTTVTLPSDMNRLVIGGSAINGGREINGTIKRLTYWPIQLTNASQSTITG